MIETITRKYHLVNSKKLKQALFITLRIQVTRTNISQYGEKLSTLINNKNDTYIFILQKSESISAYAIKLLMAFNNSISGMPGILFSEQTKELVINLGLEANFIIGMDARTIIKNIEHMNKNG